MKKFLIAILFLIPLIVVLSIQGAGYVISEWSNEKINATSIEIRNEYNEIVETGDRIVVPRFLSDGSDGFTYIYIEVKPKICYSDKVEWECSEDEGYDGEATLERVSDSKLKYKVVAKGTGNVEMRIFSETNDKASRLISIYVTSDAITDMEVYSNITDGEPQKISQWQEVSVVRPTKFMVYAQPLEAIGENRIAWSITDASVASVDRNGFVRPTGKEGTTRITAALTDKMGETHYFDFYIAVYGDLIIKETELILPLSLLEEGDGRICEAIWAEAVSAKRDSEYSAIDIVYDGEESGKRIYSLNGSKISVTFSDDGIRFVGAPTDVYMDNGGYFFEIRYTDIEKTGIPNVEYRVEDTSILTVDENGFIEPHAEGTTSVYAVEKDSGAMTETVTVTVKRRISSFQLNKSSFDNNVGILQHRIWGTYWFDDNRELTNVYALGFNVRSVYPEAKSFDLLWTVNDDSAEVDAEGNVTFLENCLGRDITVTATVLVHGLTTNLSRSYTFTMARERAINCYSIADMDDAFSEAYGKSAVCLHSDVVLNRDQHDPAVSVTNNWYGNGCLVQVEVGEDRNGHLYWSNFRADQEELNPELTELLVENVTISAAYEITEVLATTGLELRNLSIPATVRGVICRYAWTGVTIMGGAENNVFTVESSILGQCRCAGLFISDEYRDDSSKAPTVIIRNNVFRDCGCSAICSTAKDMDQSNSTQTCSMNLVFEGFTDCYSWKSVDDVGGILSAVAPSTGGSALEDLLSSVFSDAVNELMHEDYPQYVYKDEKGKEWLCMGMFAMGLFNYIDPSCFDPENIKDPSIQIVSVKMQDGYVDFASRLGMNISNPCYLLTYAFDADNAPRIKPNDPCPENKALYSRLTGGNA